MDNLEISWISGHCPVQSEGKIAGEDYYFRARGCHWLFVVGDSLSPAWTYEEPFGSGYDAGYITEEQAKKLIEKAAQKYIARNRPSDPKPE